MSRAYDARQEALNAHPESREEGVSLFLGYLGCSESDFKYEWSQSAEEYIYGKDESENTGSA